MSVFIALKCLSYWNPFIVTAISAFGRPLNVSPYFTIVYFNFLCYAINEPILGFLEIYMRVTDEANLEKTTSKRHFCDRESFCLESI